MNKYLVQFGSFGIRWYSIMILLGVIFGLLLLYKEGKRFNMNKDFLFNLLFWVVIFGIVGARAYYVIFNFDYYKNDLSSIFKIWESGLAIHGGIIAGFITLVLYCKKYNARIFKMTDMCVVPLILAQAIGRWGNFFNQEAFGSVTSYESLKAMHIPEFIIEGMNIGGKYMTPTFLYESLWCLVGFLILLIIRRFKYLKIGQLTSVYMMWYGFGRFFIERLRSDSLLIGGFKVAQLVSIMLFVIGAFAFMILSRRSKFENLYNEENADNVLF